MVTLDANGSVRGTLNHLLFGGNIIGLWDETSRKLSFTQEVRPGPTRPLFEAIVFGTPSPQEPGRDIAWTMVGFFHVIDQNVLVANGGNARRSTFGWFANITEVA